MRVSTISFGSDSYLTMALPSTLSWMSIYSAEHRMDGYCKRLKIRRVGGMSQLFANRYLCNRKWCRSKVEACKWWVQCGRIRQDEGGHKILKKALLCGVDTSVI